MTTQPSARTRLCLTGITLPAKHAADQAQLAALGTQWDIRANEGSAPTRRFARLDRIWFWADRQLFGRGRWAVKGPPVSGRNASTEDVPIEAVLDWSGGTQSSATAPEVRVEYDGLPPALLTTAIRGRIGQVGGVLPFVVFVRIDTRGFLPMLSGALRLDHRSVHRSVVLCANKLPQLLRAALDRAVSGLAAVSLVKVPSAPVGLAVLALRQVAGVIKWLVWREQWNIEIYRRNGPSSDYVLVSRLKPPDSAFWADPFLAKINERILVFFEELPFSTMRGHISAIELNETGTPAGPARIVLKEPWHLSYPFIWKEANRTLLIPESGESRSLKAYETEDGGASWKAAHTLLDDVRLADATLIRWGGRLWLFATRSDGGASMDDALCLWYAEKLGGPWHPHRLNPVKVDARYSRPAGTMWVEHGAIHRVAQDCSTTYGGATVCMRVRRLTPDDFEEEVVPGWSGRNITSRDPWHTYNNLGSLTVVDRLVQIPRWRRSGQQQTNQ